ncbi:putative uncharacterized protein [Prevotella sp. CAG:873]|nr:putative uncharacterized protein [Prevotella sp. CAG:873]
MNAVSGLTPLPMPKSRSGADEEWGTDYYNEDYRIGAHPFTDAEIKEGKGASMTLTDAAGKVIKSETYTRKPGCSTWTTAIGRTTRKAVGLAIAQARNAAGLSVRERKPGCSTWSTAIGRTTRKAVGQAIAQARNAAGLSVRDLADRCGLDAGHLCRIENGRMNVTIDTVAKICEALGLRLEAVSGSETK